MEEAGVWRRSAVDEANGTLYVLMLPWLAMGHLIPSFEFSKRLALNGVRVSIFSTPGNVRRLPPVPPHLTQLLDFLPCPLPPIENLPNDIENTGDLLSEVQRPLLEQAYNQFEHPLTALLADPSHRKPDWIICDLICSGWIPALATRFGISCALFSIFNAAVLAFLGLSPAYDSPEELTIVPDHIPFPTTVSFRRFEARQVITVLPKKSSFPSNRPEYIPPNDLILVRSCREFESKWLDLLTELHRIRNPVIPVGVLPPSMDNSVEINQKWVRVREWLDEREERSVVYVAFGTEAKLTNDQIGEIAVGLERSGLAFVWTLLAGSPSEDFEVRNSRRGLVLKDWVPQASLLAHPAIGGFLNQAGWSSVVEALAVGVAIAVLPMVFDQGLNARHFVESGYALEVTRNGENGYFSGEEIARTLRMLMVEEGGEVARRSARKAKEFFGSEKVQAEYIVEVVKRLWEKRKTVTEPTT